MLFIVFVIWLVGVVSGSKYVVKKGEEMVVYGVVFWLLFWELVLKKSLVGLLVSFCLCYSLLVVLKKVFICVVIMLNCVGNLKSMLLVFVSFCGVMIGVLVLGGVFILLSIFLDSIFGIFVCESEIDGNLVVIILDLYNMLVLVNLKIVLLLMDIDLLYFDFYVFNWSGVFFYFFSKFGNVFVGGVKFVEKMGVFFIDVWLSSELK